MCFEDNRRGNRRELICECREVRCERDHRRCCNRDRFRDDEFRFGCRGCNRGFFNRGW